MTSPRRQPAPIVPWLLLAILAAGLVAPAQVMANGSGDLYVAVGQGVAEVEAAAGSVVNLVSLRPVPTWLAFAPDGQRLYGADGTSRLTVVDIPTISVDGSLPLPGAGIAVAAPSGGLLAVALAHRPSITFVDPSGGPVRASATLPGLPDFLAADRRVSGVAALVRGGGWVAAVAPDGTVHTAQLGGRVVAAAMEPDGGGLLVATETPNAVARLALPGLTPDWRVTLPAPPRAIAVVRAAGAGRGGAASAPPGGAPRGLVATDGTLWLVGPGGARRWMPVGGPVVGLAASDGGTVAYVASGGRVVALPLDGRPSVTINVAPVNGGAVLAPVPRPGSLEGSGRAGVSTALASGRPPVTSTTAPDPGQGPPIPWVRLAAVAGAIFLGAFAVGRVLVRLLQGRSSES